MTTVSVLIPFGGQACDHRRLAFEWVTDRYRRAHPDWELVVGECAEPWSKGAAVADAHSRSTGEILVIADADSFVDAVALADLVAEVGSGVWGMPHGRVCRLSEDTTTAVYAGKALPRKLRWTDLARPAYPGVIGGGIVVLTRAAYLDVGGIDPRYLGWGGEDLSFGWALHALVSPPLRKQADLIHLWHPHPAPDLRGSPESEALVARYKAARRNPQMMREVLTR